MKTGILALVLTVAMAALGFAAFAGWAMNIYKFASCDFEPSYKAEIVHGVGIVTPIGCITGWMDLGK
jgi:hypothetical protein